MYSSPVRHSPPIRASSYCAAVRLACVRPTASVHSEPGSNSSVRSSDLRQTYLRVHLACICMLAFRTPYVSMDFVHPRRPHKSPAHTVKDLVAVQNLPVPRRRTFRSTEPAILHPFSFPSTPLFDLLASNLDANSGLPALPLPLRRCRLSEGARTILATAGNGKGSRESFFDRCAIVA